MKKHFVINGRFLTQPLTGVQRFAYELVCEISKTHSFTILTPRVKINSSYSTDTLYIKKIGFGNGYFWEQIILPVYLIFIKSPLLISLCNLSPIFYKKKITVVHDIAVIEHPEWFNWKFVLFYKFVFNQLLNSRSYIITVSQFSKSRIIDLYKLNQSKIFIIHNAVSSKLLHSKQLNIVDKNLIRFASNKFILCASSIDPRKNFKSIISAFEVLDIPDIDLVIVGKKSKVFNNPDLNLHLAKRIHFVGYVSDAELFWLYKHAECFVYLSLYEGFGIPPLEAMASGCPVLLSDIAVHREIFDDAALLVDPLSVNDIVKGLKLILNNPEKRKELIAKGHKINSKYDWKKSSELLLNFIYEINLK